MDGRSDVKAKRATPTPIMTLKTPANRMLVLEFLFDKK